MKKGLIAIVVAAVVAVGGVGGYMMYQKKAEEKAYNEEVKKAINSLPSIVVYEKEDLPTVESEFANAGSCIDINSVEPDISNVYTTEPGEYEVKYTFKDSKGEQRTATVPCIVSFLQQKLKEMHRLPLQKDRLKQLSLYMTLKRKVSSGLLMLVLMTAF